MIDRGVFRSEWAALCERFRLTGGKEPSQLMLRRYYEHLSPQLTTEQFVIAARALYASREFFPRPADFTEAALGGARDRAADEWPLFRRAIGGDRDAQAELSAAARRAAETLGGFGALGRTKLGEIDWLRRRYLEEYQAAARTARTRERSLEGVTPESRRILQDLEALP